MAVTAQPGVVFTATGAMHTVSNGNVDFLSPGQRHLLSRGDARCREYKDWNALVPVVGGCASTTAIPPPDVIGSKSWGWKAPSATRWVR